MRGAAYLRDLALLITDVVLLPFKNMVGLHEACSHFGIRRKIQHRDLNEQFPEVGKGSNFYLQEHGQDFRARRADYTPGLFNRLDLERGPIVCARSPESPAGSSSDCRGAIYI